MLIRKYSTFKFLLIYWIIPVLLLFQTGCKVEECNESLTENYWSHKFFTSYNISYVKNGNEYQKLDLYLFGETTGEPDYIKRDTTKVYPTLIYIHGGGWVGQDKLTRITYFLPFIEKGYQVVNLNYTLGVEGKNIEAIPNAVNDVMSAVKWVAENADDLLIDKNNVVIAGESAGGHLALIAGFFNSIPESHRDFVGDKLNVKAIINWFGVADVEKNWEYNAEHFHNIKKEDIPGETRNNLKPIFEKFSPVNFITKNAPDVLTIHGTDDTLVPIGQAHLLHKKLTKYKVRNRLLSLKGGKHVGFTDSQWKEAFSTIFDFLKD